MISNDPNMTDNVLANNFGTTFTTTSMIYENLSDAMVEFLRNDDGSDSSRRDPLYVVLPITIIYATIFFTGIIGNVSTCVVIARNKSMHTATNYYLFSLAISDLLLLLSGLPPEMYYIWSHFPYIFGEIFCVIQSFAAETSANATVLTITAFTVERYVAICHPFISHTMSKLSRAVKFVVAIWLLALCLAVPQAIQFGIVYTYENGTAITESARCSIKKTLIEHAFEISTMLFFVVPMTIITVLYILIAIKLRRSRLLTVTGKRTHSHPQPGALNHCDSGRKSAAQRNVIRMLVAVVIAFFICWAPFHAQRLLAVYGQSKEPKHHPVLVVVYTILTYVSGVFYYLSTTVNPLLYNIMSNKFREAFKSMLSKHCGKKWSSHKTSPKRPTYSSLTKCQKSTMRRVNEHNNHNYRHHRPHNHHSLDSRSISVSEENQKLTNPNEVELSIKNHTNEITKVIGEDQALPVSNEINETDRREIGWNLSTGSNSSHLTAMTTISKGINEGNNNLPVSCINKCLLKIQRPPKTIALGLLAERLKFTKKGLFANQQKLGRNLKTKTSNRAKKTSTSGSKEKFRNHPSIDSTNTISNSSLQDFDETEFTGSELAQYMGELNFDLIP